MYAFDMNNPFWRFIGKLVDLVWLNILTMIFSLPMITAGASCSAMYKVLMDMVTGEEGGVTKSFIRTFKENLKKATIVWIPVLVIMTIMLSNAWLIYQGVLESMPVVRNIAGVSIGFIAIVIVTFLPYFWVLLSRYDTNLKQTVKNALLLEAAFFPRSLCILIIMISPIALMTLSNYFLWFWFIYGLSIPGYVIAMLMVHILKKTSDIQKAHTGSGNAETDISDETVSDEEITETDVSDAESFSVRK